jgi:dTMP kinase
MFISIEGISGAGKTSCITFLKEKLRHVDGFVYIDEFHDREEVKRRVIESPEAKLEIFSIDNRAQAENTILPALAANMHVISDRYIDSTIVYHAMKTHSPSASWSKLRATVNNVLPDITILFDLPTRIAKERARIRDEGKPVCPLRASNTDKSRSRFLRHASLNIDRFIVINANKKAWQVEDEVFEILRASKLFALCR